MQGTHIFPFFQSICLLGARQSRLALIFTLSHLIIHQHKSTLNFCPVSHVIQTSMIAFIKKFVKIYLAIGVNLLILIQKCSCSSRSSLIATSCQFPIWNLLPYPLIASLRMALRDHHLSATNICHNSKFLSHSLLLLSPSFNMLLCHIVILYLMSAIEN